MNVEKVSFQLKDGRMAILRSPRESDAEEMLEFIIRASGETEFILRYPEEYADYTVEKEQAFLMGALESVYSAMFVCEVEGKIAGNCLLSFSRNQKEMHRASVAIALLQEYWGLGIGTEMFREMTELARKRGGILQMELNFVEGNRRAQALYEKSGFRITGIRPNSIRLKDGTLLNEISMIKTLQ